MEPFALPTARGAALDRLAALYGLERERDEADNALRRRVFEVATLPTAAYDVLRAVGASVESRGFCGTLILGPDCSGELSAWLGSTSARMSST